ncbi:MAG: DUF1320 family protein [Kaiparowitsia implicata GSE-PSE-MK54-09C]|jgi:phage gp36-like protein|nr:DUF1320 family protein [Kaiparowitsia implicata GSE-PSE-MK54-09C]
MAYATVALFIQAFGEQEAIELSALDDATAEAVVEPVIDRALDDASSLIDSYIGSRYRLPLPSTPTVLIPKCLDIARYRLDRTRARDDVRLRYEDAIRWLEQITKGIISLSLDEVGNPTQPSGSPEFNSPPSVFDRDSLSGY